MPLGRPECDMRFENGPSDAPDSLNGASRICSSSLRQLGVSRLYVIKLQFQGIIRHECASSHYSTDPGKNFQGV